MLLCRTAAPCVDGPPLSVVSWWTLGGHCCDARVHVSILSGMTPRSGLAAPSSSVHAFMEPSLFPEWSQLSTASPAMPRGSGLPSVVVVLHFWGSPSWWVWKVSPSGFDYISPVTDGVEHLFLFFLAICMTP